jgi:hypothetical protein
MWWPTWPWLWELPGERGEELEGGGPPGRGCRNYLVREEKSWKVVAHLAPSLIIMSNRLALDTCNTTTISVIYLLLRERPVNMSTVQCMFS